MTYITENRIEIIDEIIDWKDSVKLASKPLIKDGSIDELYVNNMIDSVEKHGPYMVLRDYFALLHAQPGVGVNKVASSILVNKKEIDFKGKPVKVIIVFSAIDSNSHLEMLKHISSIISDNDKFDEIIKGDRNKIIKLLKEEV